MSNKLAFKINFFNLIRFTFPSIIMMVIMSLYTIVDGTFVVRLLGTEAFSAVNLTYPLLSIILAIGTMLGSGLTAIVSIKLGEGKRQEANENFTFIIIFGACLGIILSILCKIFLKDIIYILGANEEIYKYCYDYAIPIIIFFPFDILQIMFQTLYVANGKPTIGLIVTTLGGVINILLDYIFIAKFNLGVGGAALATGLGCTFSATFGLLYFLLNRKGNLHFIKPKISWKTLFDTTTNGSSEMVSFLSTSITTFLFNIILMKLVGTDGVAAIAILLYIDFILIAVNIGYSMGVSPLISYNYGANETLKLKSLYKLSIKLCLIFGLTMSILATIFSKNLISIFVAKDSSVFILAVLGLKIYSLSYIFKGFNIFSSSLFTALGNGKISAIISFMRTLVFLTLSLLILSTLFKTTGVWSATPLAELLSFILSIFFILKYSKKYSYL